MNLDHLKYRLKASTAGVGEKGVRRSMGVGERSRWK